MSKPESLGILRLEALHYYVHDLARSTRFYVDRLDFRETGRSTARTEQDGKQRSKVFEAGACRVVVSEPQGEGGRAHRYLRKHPDGVGAMVFEVADIEKTFKLLEKRGATPISDVQTVEDDHGVMKSFSITTPFGDTTFRFVERADYKGIYPGIEPVTVAPGGNRWGFTHFDHVTSNFRTLAPMLLWLEHVMGFERYWGIEFHTNDVSPDRAVGSGLRSAVMWDPASQTKFANNEPFRPHFKSSQINLFIEDNRGEGIQHAALVTKDILPCVRGLRAAGVEFMPTPASYYEMLPGRLTSQGIGSIEEDIAVLQDLEILVDGEGAGRYLLQIFLKDSAGLYQESAAGPFFYEIIQRKGDEGFGGGNFRALFESIEREQQSAGRV